MCHCIGLSPSFFFQRNPTCVELPAIKYTLLHSGNLRKHHSAHTCLLQYTATHCTTLQHTYPSAAAVAAASAASLSTLAPLQRTTTHCNTLHRTATRCNTLQYAAAYCNTHTCLLLRLRLLLLLLFPLSDLRLRVLALCCLSALYACLLR